MTAIVTRQGKGSALTYGEMDSNLTELDTRTGSGWNDLVSDVTINPGASAPTIGTIRGGILGYFFPADTLAECFANFHLGHDYIPGTMVYPHVHWVVTTTSTGVVRWGVEWTFARRGDSPTGTVVFGPTQTLYIEHDISTPEQYMHHVNESADGLGIYDADLDVDALILTRFFRDATHPNDTFPDAVGLLTVDIHHESNKLATPLRTPPFYP